MLSNLKFYWQLLRQSVAEFLQQNLFTYAAAISYYTIFSLPPMLLIILSIASKFYHENHVRSAMTDEIGSMIGQEATDQIMSTLDQLQIQDPRMLGAALSFIVLIFTSTTVFVTMQNTLNMIFDVKPAPSRNGLLLLIRDRILSFALVLVIAFLLIVSLSLNALLVALQNYLESAYGTFPLLLAEIMSKVVPLGLIAIIFALIFRYLPDVRMAWRSTWFGAILTTILFAGGQYLISLYIGQSKIASFYHTAGSIMVIMVWVFYASMIFLLGAVITRVRIRLKEETLNTTSFAVKTEH